MDPSDAIELLQQLRSQLRAALSSTDDPDDVALGKRLFKLAGELRQSIDDKQRVSLKQRECIIRINQQAQQLAARHS